MVPSIRKPHVVVTIFAALAVIGCGRQASGPSAPNAGGERNASGSTQTKPEEPQTKPGEVALREVTLEVTGMS